ncbi:MAG: hypothetical protein QOI11_2740 [Candidatus Eremiobacteraeota bacterium]|jgi:hypothetical protein|nr:hypothetical protein [Candidatus Eremiobacteraeota bacterium]
MIAAAALTFAAFTVTLDGRTVLPRARTAVADGRVLLPVRAVGRALDADVGYDAAARVVTLRRGTRVARLPAGGAVRVVAGRAYAPLRALASAFGVGVAYDGATRTVALRDGGNVARGDETVSAGTPAAPGTVTGQAANGGAIRAGTTSISAATAIAGLQPADGTTVHEPYPTIAARVDGVAAIDRSTLRLILDGRDVSADASVVGNAVVYTPRTALPPGDHAVALAVNGLARSWRFGDSFVFATPPPGTFFGASGGPAVEAIYFDRYVGPGTNAFDVIVRGAPGLVGVVAVDGVGTLFPLRVATTDAYVAHVVLPPGLYQPFARVGVRLTLPGGEARTIVLPQTVQLQTARPPAALTAAPSPTPLPVTRPRPTLTPAPVVRPRPTRPPTAVPAPTPTPPAATHAPTPAPTATPTPPAATHAPTPAPPATKAPAAPTATPLPAPSATPTPTAKKRVILKRPPSPSPEPG